MEGMFGSTNRSIVSMQEQGNIIFKVFVLILELGVRMFIF
jgi:hypothetical protein